LLFGAFCAVAASPAAAAPDGRDGAALALLDTAKQELSAGRPEQAAALIERALRIDPRNPTLWHYLSLARLELGDSAQAEAMAAKSRSLTAPEPPRARTAREMAGDLWTSARAMVTPDEEFAALPSRNGFDTARPARQSSASGAADRGRRDRVETRTECRRVWVLDPRARGPSSFVTCDEVQRSASSDSSAASRLAANERRYYRRYESDEPRRQR
jgi:tetratricopeptide (TPR) repeat protein